MERYIQEFKPQDELLEELVTERRKEVEALQKVEADRLKDVDDRGKQRLKSLQDGVGQEIAAELKSLAKTHTSAEKETSARVETIRIRQSTIELPVPAPTEHPGSSIPRLLRRTPAAGSRRTTRPFTDQMEACTGRGTTPAHSI